MTGEAQLFDGHGGRKYLNENERLRFYEAASRLEDPIRKSFTLTVFYTGCRISEALSLTRSSIDEAEKVIVFRTLKQRGKVKYRAVPVPVELLESLLQQAERILPEARLWNFGRTTAWKAIKACMADTALEGIKATPRGLRHSFAVACVRKQVPLPTVQKLLGHSHLQTTGIYLDLIGDDERDLVSRAWPTSISDK